MHPIKFRLTLLLLFIAVGLTLSAQHRDRKVLTSKNGIELLGIFGRTGKIDGLWIHNNTGIGLIGVTPKLTIAPGNTARVNKHCKIIKVRLNDGTPPFDLLTPESRKRIEQNLKSEQSEASPTVESNPEAAASDNQGKREDVVVAQPEQSTQREEATKKVDEKPDRGAKKEDSPKKNDDKSARNKNEDSKKRNDDNAERNAPVERRRPIITAGQIEADFDRMLESDVFFSPEAQAIRKSRFSEMTDSMRLMSEERCAEYVERNNLEQYVADERASLERAVARQEKIVDDLLNSYDGDIADRSSVRQSLLARLQQMCGERNEQLAKLSTFANVEYEAVDVSGGMPLWAMVLILLAALAALGGAAYWVYTRHKPATVRRARSATRPRTVTGGARQVTSGSASADGGIVVRRVTTSVLKTQDVSDAVGNDEYLRIEAAELCGESAVRYIYVKNSCIKEIYEMYANDLRNPDRPNEDGCMVLGRWVLDGESDRYDVTLEQCVMPGDDAVFAEYELNFGGKIKIRVNERLRKLRRETDLQYDLTCWVHSHPGLGVFFSSSDNTVHHQLKHPTQPHFLTALVIDILTPEQTVGLFTFKPDGSITTKADLARTLSLEELYRWALESERSAFNPDNYYNALTGCRARRDDCRGVELSNGAIIDMAQLTVTPTTGLAGYVHGYARRKEQLTEYVADSVTRERSLDGKELVGCLVVDSHASLPGLRRALAGDLAALHFVLVYSSADDTLTAIPVVDGDLCPDATYYGKNKLEDLKIWTRRRR